MDEQMDVAARIGAISRSLVEQAVRDPQLAAAILAAACSVAAAASHEEADPEAALERGLLKMRRRARRELAVILGRTGAAA